MCVGSTVGPNIFIKICAWSTAQISRELMVQVKKEFGTILGTDAAKVISSAQKKGRAGGAFLAAEVMEVGGIYGDVAAEGNRSYRDIGLALAGGTAAAGGGAAAASGGGTAAAAGAGAHVRMAPGRHHLARRFHHHELREGCGHGDPADGDLRIGQAGHKAQHHGDFLAHAACFDPFCQPKLYHQPPRPPCRARMGVTA